MLRGAREEEAKLVRRRSRSGSFAESGGGTTSEDEQSEGRPGGLSRSLEVIAFVAATKTSCFAA